MVRPANCSASPLFLRCSLLHRSISPALSWSGQRLLTQKSSTFICTPSMPVLACSFHFLWGRDLSCGRGSGVRAPYSILACQFLLPWSTLAGFFACVKKLCHPLWPFWLPGQWGSCFIIFFQHLGLCISFCRVSPGTLF